LKKVKTYFLEKFPAFYKTGKFFQLAQLLDLLENFESVASSFCHSLQNLGVPSSWKTWKILEVLEINGRTGKNWELDVKKFGSGGN